MAILRRDASCTVISQPVSMVSSLPEAESSCSPVRPCLNAISMAGNRKIYYCNLPVVTCRTENSGVKVKDCREDRMEHLEEKMLLQGTS